MTMTYLKANPGDAQNKIDGTRGCHARFSFLKTLYRVHLTSEVEADGDGARVVYHKRCALKAYFIFLVYTSTLVEKSATHVNVIYL